MTLLDQTRPEHTDPMRRATVVAGHVELRFDGHEGRLHPEWLRHQSTEPGQIEATNRQRLYTPCDLEPGIVATDAIVVGDDLVVSFSDGHRASIPCSTLAWRLGWTRDPEAPPDPVAWPTPPEVPYVSWHGIGWSDDEADDEAVIAFLDAFYRYGCVVLRDTPVEEGTVARIANRIGYISGNNFGWVFDVRTEERPTDLAYTAIELLAHTDEPYRKAPPGIQLLHCLANEAVGGNSTLVDGLAAAEALAAERPDLYHALASIDVDFRYDMGTDTVVDVGRVIETDHRGRYRGIRFNTKIDLPVPDADADLDAWFEGRRWLATWLNDPAHTMQFRLEPGDVMFMDNRRALHGRTAFDPTTGRRHLQGCYIEHNGPDTMYRLAVRRSTGAKI